MKTILLAILCLTFITHNLAYAEFDPFNVYQWKSDSQKPWYEWWYYKVILPETQEAFFFVYGIVNPWDHATSLKGTRSYVTMGDFSNMAQIENRFSIEQFHAAYNQTFVDVAGLSATDQNIKGDLKDSNGETSSWNISIQKDWAFNAMGWAIDKDITNIKWYPAQASAHCSGSIVSKGKLYQFTDAPCYQDRNWGTSFPLWWTWIVSNHFENNPDTALAIGGGRPQYFNTNLPYQGVSVGLKHKGKVYHFRPNDFDNVKIDITFGKWEVTANNQTDKIEISAFAPKEKFMDLQFMTPTGEIFHDYEALAGEVTVKLYKKEKFNWQLTETLFSKAAGIEYGGPNAVKQFSDDFFTTSTHLQ